MPGYQLNFFSPDLADLSKNQSAGPAAITNTHLKDYHKKRKSHRPRIFAHLVSVGVAGALFCETHSPGPKSFFQKLRAICVTAKSDVSFANKTALLPFSGDGQKPYKSLFMNYLILVCIGILLISCQAGQPVLNGQQQAVDELNKDSIIQAAQRQADIFYQQRKDQYQEGQELLLEGRRFNFNKNLRLVNYDTLVKGVFVSSNLELAPGIAFVKEKPDRPLKGRASEFPAVYYKKLIYFDTAFQIYHRFVIDAHNPFLKQGYKISCENCVDGETAVANNWDKNPGYDLRANAHHYWTRPTQLGYNDFGYVVIQYAISARTADDRLIDDINHFTVLDSRGQVIHELKDIQLDVTRADISLCGQFLILHYGGPLTSDLDLIRDAGVYVYDLKTGSRVLEYDHGFNIPVFERASNQYILSYREEEPADTVYYKTMLFFNFSKREVSVLEISKTQWDSVSQNWHRILVYDQLLKIFPSTKKTF